MKKLTIIIIAILLVILVVKLKDSFSINIGPKNINTPTNATSPTSSNSPRANVDARRGEAGAVSGLETQESNDDPVTVAVTPRSLKEGSSSWDFDITLNTHSEELNEDLVAVSELMGDQGKSYKPISWEGDNPRGHHREGVLKFNPISPKPKSLELKIRNVGGVLERRFKWSL